MSLNQWLTSGHDPDVGFTAPAAGQALGAPGTLWWGHCGSDGDAAQGRSPAREAGSKCPPSLGYPRRKKLGSRSGGWGGYRHVRWRSTEPGGQAAGVGEHLETVCGAVEVL